MGSFHLFWGGGGKDRERGGTQAPVNVDTAPLTEPSYDCLSPSTLPAQHGPSLSAPMQHKLPHSISVSVGPERRRDSGWAQPGQAFFPDSSEGTR